MKQNESYKVELFELKLEIVELKKELNLVLRLNQDYEEFKNHVNQEVSMIHGDIIINTKEISVLKKQISTIEKSGNKFVNASNHDELLTKVVNIEKDLDSKGEGELSKFVLDKMNKLSKLNPFQKQRES